METPALVIIAASLLAYSAVTRRLRATSLTGPILFCALGVVVGPLGLGLADIGDERSILALVAELTLILVLFADAARIDLRQLRPDHNLPLRMLGLGLPLTLLFGCGVALVMFPEFGIWEAALLSALLAPTDAALGQSVVSNRNVPSRIRQAINVESGLNDGLALPAVLMFVALATQGPDAPEASYWLRFGVLQVLLGPIVGVIAGIAGARLIDKALENGWASTASSGLFLLSLAGLCYLAAEMIGGNGFIAVFAGGMAFGAVVKGRLDFLARFIESEGQLLLLVAFLVFGISLLPEGLASLRPEYLFYAVLSLTVIRMVPVALSLIGCGLKMPTVIFLGWFGPRGLASILYILLILKSASIPHQSEILSIVVVTVALSIVLHGISAAPLAAIYAKSTSAREREAETREVTEIPYRFRARSNTRNS